LVNSHDASVTHLCVPRLSVWEVLSSLEKVVMVLFYLRRE
jgi:hypothetical protein